LPLSLHLTIMVHLDESSAYRGANRHPGVPALALRTQPMAITLVSVEAREVLRCDYCSLVQFRTSNSLCRRCHRPLEVEELLPPAPQLVASQSASAEAGLQVAGQVREIRKARHLSQRQLAGRMQVPRTYISKIENGKENINYYNTGEVEAKFFKDSGSLRKIFEKRFKQVGGEYYHPHTFRHSWVKEMAKLPLTEEEKKAISQNLGHEDVSTTFGNYGYGKMDESRQIELMRSIDFEGRKKEIKQYMSIDDVRQLLKEQEDNKNKPATA